MHTIPLDLRAFKIEDPAPECARWKDHMPRTRNADSYRLYIDARKAWRSKIAWQHSRDELLRILQAVKTSAAQGDWGARALLAHFYLRGLGPLDTNHVLDPAPEKSIELVRMAVAAGQPWGYYDLGVAYEHGYGGIPYDQDIAWAYYLKAAELGSPDAQMALASAYGEVDRLEAEHAMLMCAYKQGHGPAAEQLAIYARLYKRFGEAAKFYQQGTKFGSKECASALMLFFNAEIWSQRSNEEKDELRQEGIVADSTRADGYRTISELLAINPDLRLSRLDKILPLPPAELPEWHGIEAALDPEPEGPPTY